MRVNVVRAVKLQKVHSSLHTIMVKLMAIEDTAQWAKTVAPIADGITSAMSHTENLLQEIEQ